MTTMLVDNEAASAAFAAYSEARQAFERVWADPLAAPTAKREQLQRVTAAESRFKRMYLALNEPTPAQLIDERNGIAIEGTLLLIAVCAFIAFLLPGFIADFWSIAIVLVPAVGLGGWLLRFTGRLANHLRRRL